MENVRLVTLINRLMDHTITEAEHNELLEYLADLPNKHHAARLFAEVWERFKPSGTYAMESRGAAMLQRILDQRPKTEWKKTVSKGPLATPLKILAAASVIFVAIAIGYIVRWDKSDAGLTLEQAVTQYGIEPGTDKAVITLSDGRTIALDGTGEVLLAEDGGMRITKREDGEINYEPLAPRSAAPIAYNTIFIPKGGQYRLVLPDGSKVHLNSLTTLKYPTRFTGNERMVELEGEAYFEVSEHQETSEPAHSKISAERTGSNKIPFIVKSRTQEVVVLGTVFNVNAYNGNEVKTTLVEGHVRVKANGSTVLLHPGEQAINRNDRPDLQVVSANMDEELAWHHGYFIFNDEDIKSIMERVARWYNVEVEYQGNMADKKFGGVFQRSKSMAQLLENLKETGLITFSIEGRRVTVMEQ